MKKWIAAAALGAVFGAHAQNKVTIPADTGAQLRALDATCRQALAQFPSVSSTTNIETIADFSRVSMEDALILQKLECLRLTFSGAGTVQYPTGQSRFIVDMRTGRVRTVNGIPVLENQ
jgi:hypothetical protein